MPPVFIYRHAAHSIEEILLKGMPLGAMKKFPYVVHEEELREGDAVLLVSDGLPEQKNVAGEMFDYARLQENFRQASNEPPQKIIERLIAAGDQWMNGATQDDDITIIALKMKSSNGASG
jgi:sigma-B regulation protein RsbU (phosphoserine phosphatase)